MPTVTFSYTITASLAAPVSHFGYAVRVPSDTGRQLLRRQHLAFPEGGPKLEKLDPLGNRILTGIHRGTSARLAFTVSGKARIEPDQAEEGSMELYNGQTFRTGAGGLLRSCYLHNSAVGDAPDRTRHFCLMLRDEFSCRRGLPSHRTAEEAMEDHIGPPEDLAHIVLSLCRMDHIMARYVTGISGQGASVWVEVWNGSHWIPIDPATAQICDHRYLKIAHGRDGGDVILIALSNGCTVSRAEMHSTLTVDHAH